MVRETARISEHNRKNNLKLTKSVPLDFKYNEPGTNNLRAGSSSQTKYTSQLQRARASVPRQTSHDLSKYPDVPPDSPTMKRPLIASGISDSENFKPDDKKRRLSVAGNFAQNVPGCYTKFCNGVKSTDETFGSRTSLTKSSAGSFRSAALPPLRTQSLQNISPKRSDSLNSVHSIAASDGTCKNDYADAAECFDYFTFAVHWPITQAFAGRKLRQRRVAHHNLVTDWYIHGLWPSAVNDPHRKPPVRCIKRSARFDLDQLKRYRLTGPLHENWFSVFDDQYNPDESFWSHEFNTHGKCAIRAKRIGDTAGYFKMALQLHHELKLKDTLAKGGYNVGDKMKLQDIYDIIHRHHRAKPEIILSFNEVNIFLYHLIKSIFLSMFLVSLISLVKIFWTFL